MPEKPLRCEARTFHEDYKGRRRTLARCTLEPGHPKVPSPSGIVFDHVHDSKRTLLFFKEEDENV